MDDKKQRRMAILSAGFLPVPAVDGGAGEVLTTELINGNEIEGDYYIDIYTIESPKLRSIVYKNADIVQIHISKINWVMCKTRNMFLKLFKRKYRFIPYNRALLKRFRDNYDLILVENNMQVYEDIYKHAKNGTNHMIYHMHNDIDGTTKPEYLCKFIASTAETILPVSKYIKNHFYEVAPNDKMKVFYNCIDFDVFDIKKNYDTKQLKQKYGLNESDFVFLYTGRICPEKGVLELLQAFKLLSEKYDNIKLMIIGSRWYNLIDKDEYFERLVKESKGYENKITFTGYVYPKDMPSIYTLGNVLVIPSMWEEPFGVVALEGMAMKIPIISTDSGGIVEVLDDKTAIIISREGDIVDRLSKAMEEMMKDGDLRNKLLNVAYDKVIERKEYDKKNYFRGFISRL